jgi:2-methylcitrate dehydratase PrpD
MAHKGVSSRCVMLGIAAQNGVIAAFSAQEGFVGDDTLLDKGFGQAHGITVETDKLIDGLGQGFHIDQSGFKPFPVAGQALSAVEAFREIMATHRIAAESIQEVSVHVPKAFIAMIDRPKLAETHIESVLSVQYQIAVVAFIPDGLLDVTRTQLIKDNRIMRFVNKIRVKPSEQLEAYSSSAFPARVEVQTDRQRYYQEIIHPKGDPRNRFSWEELIEKFRWVTKPVLEQKVVDQVINGGRNLDTLDDLTELLELLT